MSRGESVALRPGISVCLVSAQVHADSTRVTFGLALTCHALRLIAGCACRWSSLKAVRPFLRLTHMPLTVLEKASCWGVGVRVCNRQIYCLILLLPDCEIVPGGNDWNVVRAANGAFVAFSNPRQCHHHCADLVAALHRLHQDGAHLLCCVRVAALHCLYRWY